MTTKKVRKATAYSADPSVLARQVQELAQDVDRLLAKLDADDDGRLEVEGELIFVQDR